MKVKLTRQDDSFHFQGINESLKTLEIDSSPDFGGNNLGVRPMELLLFGLGGCSGIDVINILKKQRQTISHFEIEVNGERDKGKDANLFVKIHIHFSLSGQIDKEKLETAISLSLEKYCSVAKTLEKTATITSSCTISEPEKN